MLAYPLVNPSMISRVAARGITSTMYENCEGEKSCKFTETIVSFLAPLWSEEGVDLCEECVKTNKYAVILQRPSGQVCAGLVFNFGDTDNGHAFILREEIVRKDLRRQGYGRLLFECTESHCADIVSVAPPLYCTRKFEGARSVFEFRLVAYIDDDLSTEDDPTSRYDDMSQDGEVVDEILNDPEPSPVPVPVPAAMPAAVPQLEPEPAGTGVPAVVSILQQRRHKARMDGVLEMDGPAEEESEFVYMIKEKRLDNGEGHGAFLAKLGWTAVQWQHDENGCLVSQYGESDSEIAFVKIVAL